jgi:hypothetical protein
MSTLHLAAGLERPNTCTEHISSMATTRSALWTI